MDAAQRQVDGTEPDPAPLDGEPLGALLRADVDGAHIGILGGAVGRRAVAGRQRAAHRVVGTDHGGPVDLGEVLVEARLDRSEGAVVVEVIDLDVGEHRGVEREFEVSAVALVGLDDEPLAAGPLGTGAGVGYVATDDEARLEARLGQDEHEHRRGRGLAVRSRDSDRAGLRADGGQHAGASERGDASCSRLVELDVLLRHGRAVGDGIAAIDVIASMTHLHIDVGGTQAIEHRPLADVAATHAMPHLGEHDGNRAHAGAADADHVKTLWRRQVERGDGLAHRAATTSINSINESPR